MKQFLMGTKRFKSGLNIFVLAIAALIFCFTLKSAPANAVSIYSLPQIAAGDSVWVIDPAEVISRATESKLNSTLAKLAAETNQELRLVAIRRQGYDDGIDIFADKLFQRWFPDAETAANQTIVAIDTVSNNSAIRTGKDGEILSSETIDSIISDTIGADLKQGNKYNQAFLDASARLSTILAGNPDPGPTLVAEQINTEGTFTKAEDTDQGSATFWVIGLLVLGTIIPMATYFFYVGFSN